MTTTAPDGAATLAASVGVLRTRLLPPRLPPNSVARPALVARVHRGLEGRVLALVAGADYGKTTALVQALESSPLPSVWLSCDARLRTADMLIAHVTAGVAGPFREWTARCPAPRARSAGSPRSPTRSSRPFPATSPSPQTT